MPPPPINNTMPLPPINNATPPPPINNAMPLPPIDNAMPPPPPINNAMLPLPNNKPMPPPPPPTGLASTSSTAPTGPPENENEYPRNEGVGQGSKPDEASVCSRLQVLTKDELKEVMKACNMVSSGINRCLKDGKLL